MIRIEIDRRLDHKRLRSLSYHIGRLCEAWANIDEQEDEENKRLNGDFKKNNSQDDIPSPAVLITAAKIITGQFTNEEIEESENTEELSNINPAQEFGKSQEFQKPTELLSVPVSATVYDTQTRKSTHYSLADTQEITPFAIERDCFYRRWDERIHASTKTKTANGAWRSKRGVDEAYIKQIEKELDDANMPIADFETNQSIPVKISNGEGQAEIPKPPQVEEQKIITTFTELMQFIEDITSKDLISHNQIFNIVRRHGVEDMTQLTTNEHLITGIHQELLDKIKPIDVEY